MDRVTNSEKWLRPKSLRNKFMSNFDGNQLCLSKCTLDIVGNYMITQESSFYHICKEKSCKYELLSMSQKVLIAVIVWKV